MTTVDPHSIGARFVESDEYRTLKAKIEARDRQRRQSRRLTMIAAAVIVATAVLLFTAGRASARIAPAFLSHHHTSVRVHSSIVLGHRVRVVTWRPGNRYVRALVRFGLRRRTVPQWAQARSTRSRAVAAMNGGTWLWRSGRPIGTVWAAGHRITRTSSRPAVGFLPRGRVVFGARAARHAGAVNILAGEATLIRHGRILRRYPWATAGQESCGPRGTDGAGCFRSNVVRFKSGRIGMVEVAFASMRTAARVLKAMHVVGAVTYDSGGSANLWTSVGGSGGCADPRARGRCFGIAHAAGLHWERQVPTAFTILLRRHP